MCSFTTPSLWFSFVFLSSQEEFLFEANKMEYVTVFSFGQFFDTQHLEQFLMHLQ